MGALGDTIRSAAADLIADAISVDTLEAGGPPPPPPPDTRPTKLIGFGDSVMLGVRTGVVAADTYLAKIGVARGFANVQNMGIGGNNVSQMFDRLQTVRDQVVGFNSHVLVSEHINSNSVALPVATYKAKLLAIVQTLLGDGAKVTVATGTLWTSTPAINTMQPYLDAAQEVGEMTGVSAFVDLYLNNIHAYFQMTRANFDLLYCVSDTQHPSASGHTRHKDYLLKFPKACCLN